MRVDWSSWTGNKLITRPGLEECIQCVCLWQTAGAKDGNICPRREFLEAKHHYDAGRKTGL